MTSMRTHSTDSTGAEWSSRVRHDISDLELVRYDELVGYLDRIEGPEITGWMYNDARPDETVRFALGSTAKRS